MSEEFIDIGKIVNTQGIKGEVRILPLTDSPERFDELDAVNILLNGDRFAYHLERWRKHKQFVVVKFKEVPDIDAAEKLKGSTVQIPREQLKSLPENSYYIFEIIGLDVIDENGKSLGKVKNVLETGANDIYVVKPPQGKDILVPALKHVVKEIDMENNQMVVELPEGLLDL
ncbi:MAG: ribosome maturation factor RimM [Firmicutes bacterium]|nr:ribosome maturation factor RimM [Bacillota bacterium]